MSARTISSENPRLNMNLRDGAKAEFEVPSPAGLSRLTFSRQAGSLPIRCDAVQILGRTPSQPVRHFAREVGAQIWVNSLTRGLDGNLPPLPKQEPRFAGKNKATPVRMLEGSLKI